VAIQEYGPDRCPWNASVTRILGGIDWTDHAKAGWSKAIRLRRW
jgi:hypothetical protein